MSSSCPACGSKPVMTYRSYSRRGGLAVSPVLPEVWPVLHASGAKADLALDAVRGPIRMALGSIAGMLLSGLIGGATGSIAGRSRRWPHTGKFLMQRLQPYLPY